ncbi:nucleotidyl transferase AbiEii/AbiGii toxin family protein [Pelagicoccus mobilis]|uniref:Nucleotidyl transferase AbiEii/AbiGii toxin family protein n=1 Tax=Pelagicoccus mobilis TaxID=415221 RepID=A0A934S154_9BACT|nr:nucleotidyl transferase AbiEii/AbiGii toxin family protein [Pelagicoccus mobilis]MBK1877962.1 nucleotidyl transferase AbiEii/AbiGii toxin family protein [Pelagicoccus mobilis]
MNTFATLPASERQLYFQQYQGTQGIDTTIVEKDFWVCWLLGILFRTEPLSQNCVFKGGTSLSKVYNAIHRFSEDIDLSVDPGFLGCEESVLEDAELSNTKRNRLSEALQKACADAVESQLQPLLETEISNILGEVEGNEPWLSYELDGGTNSPVLLFHYPSDRKAKEGSYIPPWVKLEFGSLTDQRPTGSCEVTAMIDELAPGHFADSKAQVVALEIERTFWEKATILHAEHHRPNLRNRDRFSRHYADFAALWDNPVRQKAIQSDELLNRVVQHKSRFFRSSWANYDTAKRGTFKLLPKPEAIENLKKDYKAMEQMFFRTPSPFEEILDTLREAEKTLNE